MRLIIDVQSRSSGFSAAAEKPRDAVYYLEMLIRIKKTTCHKISCKKCTHNTLPNLYLTELKSFYDMFSRLYHDCDGRTDGQTERSLHIAGLHAMLRAAKKSKRIHRQRM